MHSSSSSSLDCPKMNYDVFISFRGKDVRHTFVGYLYDALDRLGIKAFMDDKRFQIGDNLQSLFQIIDESRSAIVVLSEDYASAKWCLRELTKIMDSMGTTMDRVLPVFYHVDPSMVKNQFGTFKISFDEHEVNALKEIDNQEKEKHLKELQNWKNAMRKIGNHTGVVITKNSSEVDIVKKIANQIFNVWRPKLEALNKNLVGMTSRLLHMNMHLGLGLDDIRFVAIVGMGGIGKTTIAQVVFNCILPKFDDCCFLTLPGADSKQSIVSLQREMLSQIFHKEDFRIWHENHGAEMIKYRLSGRKVLIVLDGVEEIRQLEMLAGSTEWFGPGSRVIITARNKGLLNHPNYDEMKEYNVEELEHDRALHLFLKHAFGSNDQNNESFMDLSNEIVEKAKRLPLALRVIGSFLYGKEIAIWRETLRRLIKVDERRFFDVLKISYDGLGVESQQVFLDITCFFNGRNEDRVVEILESFGYSPKSEIQLLMQRCLIEVSHKKICVHDLILEMGREIVLKESLTQPGKQSRIWLHEDLFCKFAEKYDLMHIQGIVLSLEKEMEESIQLDAEIFLKMTKLKILEINNVELFEDIEYLSQLLRIIKWHGYPSKSLPPTFQSPYLFELLLPCSHILRLWDGKKRFPKLKVIDVSNSKHLRVTPDFSGVPNLERLVLSNCVRLCEIHPSINFLNNLILLNLNGCGDLKYFPPNIRCKNLQTLILSRTGLETSPEMGENMEGLTKLYLDGSNITKLHPSIGHLTGLVLLNLSCCLGLSSLPCEIGNLRSLKTLLLGHCRKLEQIPPSLANAKWLETLSISETSIRHIPSSMHCLKNLKTLECDGLSGGEIWKSLLPQFKIDGNIISSGLECLETLSLINCNLVDEDVPEDLHCFSSLQTLNLSDNNFTTLPDSLSHLRKLKTLLLDNCTKLKKLSELPPSFLSVALEEGSSLTGHILIKATALEFTSVFESLRVKQRCLEESISDEMVYGDIGEYGHVMECLNQRNEGNWIIIEHNQEYYSSISNDISNNVCGVLLSANVEYYQQTSDHFNDIDHANFTVGFEIEGNSLGCLMIKLQCKFLCATNILVGYLPTKIYVEGLMVHSSCCIKAKISCDNKYLKIKECGASILSWKDLPEYLPKLFTQLYSSTHKFQIGYTPHRPECWCNDLQVAEDDFSPSTFQSDDSTFLGRRNLKSLLGRIFEEQKRRFVGYFFPQTKTSGWSRNQYKRNKVAVKLPVNIHKDKKWMGLAMFVVFSISEKAKCCCFDFLIMQSSGKRVCNHGDCIPMKLLEYSNQVLFVLFVPQTHVYPVYHDQQNSSTSSSNDHVYISFNTNVDRMRVELCGARLVYRQNVDGLIHTIVDCVMESGDELYEYYYQKIVEDHLTTIHLQKHQDSSLQDASMNKQQNNSLTRTDSSLSVEHLLHGCFPHPFFHKSTQERLKSQFDLILRGDKIPEFFTNQSVGNEAGIKIPEYMGKLYEGIAVCGLVVVDKQMRKLIINNIQERKRYTKVVRLMCKFKVDSYEILPVHCHFLSQEKLLSQYASQFIWIYYISFAEFRVFWHNCNHLEMALETTIDDLFRVQHCGLHLIHSNDRKAIDKMIMESTLPTSITHEETESQP